VKPIKLIPLLSFLLVLALACSSGDDAGPGTPGNGSGTADALDTGTALSTYAAAAATISLAVQIGEPIGAAIQAAPVAASPTARGVMPKGGSTGSRPLPGLCFGGGNASVTERNGGVTVNLSSCIGRGPSALPLSGSIDFDVTDTGSIGLLPSGTGRLNLTTSSGTVIAGELFVSVDFARTGMVFVRLGDSLDTDQLSVTENGQPLSQLGCFEIVMAFNQVANGLQLARVTPLSVASRRNGGDTLDRGYTVNDYAAGNPFVVFDANALPQSGNLALHSGDRSADSDERTQSCPGFGSSGDGSFANALFMPGGCIEISGQNGQGQPFELETNWEKLLSGDLSDGGGVPCGDVPPIEPPIEPPPIDPNLRQHVMAITPRGPGSTLEVWVSRDGLQWDGPAYPLLRDCEVPVEVDSAVPPGLGATSTHYLAAAYDVNGTLYYSKSRNGIHWENPVETITVDDGLSQESRPSVVFERSIDTWFALVSTYDDVINPPRYDVVHLDLDGVGSALSQVPGPNSKTGPHVTYTGIEDREYMVTGARESGAGLDFRAGFPEPISTAQSYPGFFNDPRDPIASRGAPSGSSILDQIFVVTNEDTVIPGEVPLTVGENRVWEYDYVTDAWTSLFTVGPTASSHEGASIAGPLVDLVVASPGRTDYTDIWHVGQGPGGFSFEHVEVRTRSNRIPALAFGPVQGGGYDAQACCERDDPQCESILVSNLFMRFRSFKRTMPPDPGDFGAAEDVELNVTIHTKLGALKKEFDADPQTPGVQGLVVSDATLNQGHQFNEGNPGASLPTFNATILPDDVVTVSLTGTEAGPSSVVIPFAQLAAPQGANRKNTRTVNQVGDPIYQLEYDASARPPE
jgi:hypothetical protein